LSLSGIYLACYSVMRFTLEFFRGDIIRGKAMGISTSQWISVFVFAAGIILIVQKAKTGKISVPK
ncbi:MAG: prolipoprotein diacylglyceryl transferase family protein, partial [Oscillospiraceae bacterium]